MKEGFERKTSEPSYLEIFGFMDDHIDGGVPHGTSSMGTPSTLTLLSI